MTGIDAFTATVGVALLENFTALPWRETLPSPLLRSRGWFWREPAEILSLVQVVCADDLDEVGVWTLVASWHAWLEALDATDGLLVLAWSGDPPYALADLVPADRPRGRAWLVDLPGQRIVRREGDDDDLGFTPAGAIVDEAIANYFAGNALTHVDLFELEASRLAGRQPFVAFLDHQRTPVSWALLALIGGFYLLTESLGGNQTYRLLRAGANYRPLFEAGEVWRLVSANFLHVGYVHLFVNAYSLFAVGPTLEKLFGSSKFLAIYLLAGVAGSVGSLAFNREVPSAGASGALFGLLGAMLVLGLFYRGAIPDHAKRSMRQVALVTLAINLAVGFMIPHIDNFAHLGGLLGGCAMAALVGPHPALIGRRSAPWLDRLLGLVPAAAVVALGVGLAYTLGGQVPVMRQEGPARDFVVAVPSNMDVTLTNHFIYLSTDQNQHWVLLGSVENDGGELGVGQAPLAERNLAAFADVLARKYAVGDARLADRPGLVKAGRHWFVRVDLRLPDDSREAVYITASDARVYAIRTRGLSTTPWVKDVLKRSLETFEIRNPR